MAIAEHGRATRPMGRNVVLLCAEDDDLEPPLVRLIDEGIRRSLPLEVVVLEGSDPMPGLLFTRPSALFVLLRSRALCQDIVDAVRRGFGAFCRPNHALWEASLDEAAGHPSLVRMIEREVRSAALIGPATLPDLSAGRPRRSRQFFIADARTIDEAFEERRAALR